jgi:hypothetical protein
MQIAGNKKVNALLHCAGCGEVIENHKRAGAEPAIIVTSDLDAAPKRRPGI